MPWNGGPGAGFTTGRPWIRIGADAASRNVEAQAAEPDSVLACYRRLLAARRASPALNGGSFMRVAVDAPDVLAWQRRTATETVLVLVNFSPETRSVQWTDPLNVAAGVAPIVGTHREPARPSGPNEITLRPLEGVVLGRG
jgi:alpha-glucosidase